MFGLKSHGIKNSGPFGDELIAGSYLQKLSLLSIFYSFLIFKNKKYKNIFIIFIILLHSTAILLAGNKMSLILFLFGSILTILLVKNLRFSISVGLIAFLSISIITFKNDQNLGSVYLNFFEELNLITIIKQNIEIRCLVKRPILCVKNNCSFEFYHDSFYSVIVGD